MTVTAAAAPRGAHLMGEGCASLAAVAPRVGPEHATPPPHGQEEVGPVAHRLWEAELGQTQALLMGGWQGGAKPSAPRHHPSPALEH